MKMDKRPAAERFHDLYEPEPNTGCWLWVGTTREDGYGRISVKGRHVSAHRFAYELLVGPIPAGLQIDHLCRQRSCVNPRHLEPVTAHENTLRGETVNAKNTAKTVCKNGHPFTEDNTWVVTRGSKGGKKRATERICKTCRALKTYGAPVFHAENAPRTCEFVAQRRGPDAA